MDDMIGEWLERCEKAARAVLKVAGAKADYPDYLGLLPKGRPENRIQCAAQALFHARCLGTARAEAATDNAVYHAVHLAEQMRNIGVIPLVKRGRKERSGGAKGLSSQRKTAADKDEIRCLEYFRWQRLYPNHTPTSIAKITSRKLKERFLDRNGKPERGYSFDAIKDAFERSKWGWPPKAHTDQE